MSWSAVAVDTLVMPASRFMSPCTRACVQPVMSTIRLATWALRVRSSSFSSATLIRCVGTSPASVGTSGNSIVSIGSAPDPYDDFEDNFDFQMAGFYRWVLDELEQLSGVRVTDLHKHIVDEVTIKKDGKIYRRTPDVPPSTDVAG